MCGGEEGWKDECVSEGREGEWGWVPDFIITTSHMLPLIDTWQLLCIPIPSSPQVNDGGLWNENGNETGSFSVGPGNET